MSGKDESSQTPPGATQPERMLPFSYWLPGVAGIVGGVLTRFVFSGAPGGSYAAMMASFIYLAPFFVGALTVFVAERIRRRTWGYYIYASFLANVLFIAGTLLIMIEGLICAIVIVPVFAAFGAFGGLAMGAICRLTNWPRPAMYCIAVLPLMGGYLETNLSLPEHIETVERTVWIDAAPEVVWRNIHDTPRVSSEEAGAWIYRIGAPLPQSGVTQQTTAGPVRTVTMSKHVRFEQQFTHWEENRSARWKYRFSPDSFPPGALDEHVMIGGHYFDMQEGAFELQPRDGGTALSMRIRFRVSTQFNWYARPVGRALIGDLEETVLAFYRRHSEREKA